MVGSCLNTGLGLEVWTSATCAGEQASFAPADKYGLLLKPAILEHYLGSLVRCCELSLPALLKDFFGSLVLFMRRPSRGSTRGRFCLETSLGASCEIVSPRLLLYGHCDAESGLSSCAVLLLLEAMLGLPGIDLGLDWTCRAVIANHRQTLFDLSFWSLMS